MTYSIDVHGVSLSIESDNNGLIAFARSYFAGFPEITGSSSISCSISFRSGFSFRFSYPHVEYSHTLGSGIGWDEKTQTITVSDHGWTLIASKNGGRWVASVFHTRNFWRHLVSILSVGTKELRRRNYRAAIRILPQQLLFAELAAKGIVARSGAAVVLNGKAHAFFGLPGSGKSTLARALKNKISASVLTENFVLTDGRMMYPYPEGNTGAIQPIPLGSMQAISHGQEFSVTQISSENLYSMIDAIDAITAELPEESKLAAFILTGNTMFSRKEIVHSSGIPCYRLSVDPGATLAVNHFSRL